MYGRSSVIALTASAICVNGTDSGLLELLSDKGSEAQGTRGGRMYPGGLMLLRAGVLLVAVVVTTAAAATESCCRKGEVSMCSNLPRTACISTAAADVSLEAFNGHAPVQRLRGGGAVELTGG